MYKNLASSLTSLSPVYHQPLTSLSPTGSNLSITDVICFIIELPGRDIKSETNLKQKLLNSQEIINDVHYYTLGVRKMQERCKKQEGRGSTQFPGTKRRNLQTYSFWLELLQ